MSGATTARMTVITTTQAGAQNGSDRENQMIALEKTVALLRNEIEALKVFNLLHDGH